MIRLKSFTLGLFYFGTLAGAQESPPVVSPVDTAPPRARVNFLPVLGSAPETGFQYGVAVFATKAHRIERTRPATLMSNAIRTAKGQSRVFVDVDRWTARNDWRFAGTVIWQEFPQSFFGIGEDAAEAAGERYTPRGTDLGATVQRRIARSKWLLLNVRRTELAIIKTEAGGQLEPGTIIGSRGGRTVLATTGLIVDERDNIFAPTRGRFGEFTVGRADDAWGSEFEFTRVRVELRAYSSFGRGHVFATHGILQGVSSAAPFDQLPAIGSASMMRGYLPGRFRDQWMQAVQAEFRSAIHGSWGYAVFAGAGSIGSSISDLLVDGRNFPSFGGGARYRMDPRTGARIRVDYAFGTRGQRGLYVSFSEAF